MNRRVSFTVNLIPVSKKNSQQIWINRKTHKPFITPSDKYKEYEKNCSEYMPKIDTIDYPVNIKCVFYMPTRRRCDLTNLLEAIDDVMVKYGVIKDDSFNIIVGHDGSRVMHDKNNPRTEVYIREIDDVDCN